MLKCFVTMVIGLWKKQAIGSTNYIPVLRAQYCCSRSCATRFCFTEGLFRASHSFVSVGFACDGGAKFNHLWRISRRKATGPPGMSIGVASTVFNSSNPSPSCRPRSFQWLVMGWRWFMRKPRSSGSTKDNSTMVNHAGPKISIFEHCPRQYWQ